MYYIPFSWALRQPAVYRLGTATLQGYLPPSVLGMQFYTVNGRYNPSTQTLGPLPVRIGMRFGFAFYIQPPPPPPQGTFFNGPPT